ncbi:MAG TPA: YMGG-like glycine zipper-containing protein [Syntrophorhabdaceae bacterium]|nr:YMGG-like glycine zipper-containing protein [Syntrophorhabdaceae bacterium]
MKGILATLVIIATGFTMFSCASEGYNTQKGAAIGAGLGAIAGQVIGHDTASTLIGAAVGGLAGAVGGNAVDQNVQNQKIDAQRSQAVAVPAPAPQAQEAPPGQWVEVPGQWSGGKWVPAHRVWVPVNP